MEKKIYEIPVTEVVRMEISGDLLDWVTSPGEDGPDVPEGKQNFFDDDEWREEDILLNVNPWE